MEKLRMIRGSVDRAEEVMEMLMRWGAKDVGGCGFADENCYYFVINGKAKWMHKDEPLLKYLNYEVVELPDPKESEDEKIRKSLISFLKSPFVNENITDEKVSPWIAWLEKQGESYTKKDVDDAWLKGICDAKREIEKQGEKGGDE